MDWSKMVNEEPLWNRISEQQFLSEDFMREHKHLLNWKYICYRQRLSISFLQEMEEEEKIYWYALSQNENIHESVVESFEAYAWDWHRISRYYDLSFPFVKKYIKRLNLVSLKKNKHLTFTEEQWSEVTNIKYPVYPVHYN